MIWNRVALTIIMTTTTSCFLLTLIQFTRIKQNGYLPSIPKAHLNDTIWVDAQRCVLTSPSSMQGFTMRHLLSSWPANKTRGFIYLLVPPKRIKSILPLLDAINENFSRRFRYPIVVFSESKDAVETLRARLSHWKTTTVYATQVFAYDISTYWKVPQFMLDRHGDSADELMRHAHERIVASGCSSPRDLNYCLMCRFHSKIVTEIPFVQGFEYAWRLDTDSWLCGPIDFDIFAYMKQYDYWQGHLLVASYDDCAGNLTQHVQRFVKKYQIVPAQGFASIVNSQNDYIYNNFEIFRVDFCLTPEYKLFMNFTDYSGGYFYYRWGDAPLRTQAMRLFMPKERMIVFKPPEVLYRHKSFDTC